MVFVFFFTLAEEAPLAGEEASVDAGAGGLAADEEGAAGGTLSARPNAASLDSKDSSELIPPPPRLWTVPLPSAVVVPPGSRVGGCGLNPNVVWPPAKAQVVKRTC